MRRIVANFGIGRELPRPRSSANIMYLFVISPFSSLSRKSVNGGFRAMKGEKFLLRLVRASFHAYGFKNVFV